MSNKTFAPALTAAVMFLGLSSAAHAHFRLLAPASWTVQSADGDPQKTAPCGGTGGTKTSAVTNLKAGQKLMIMVSEEVPHPGHYRVSLALNSQAEFKDPMVMARPNGISISAAIQNPPVMPVIGDGLWVHTINDVIAKKMQAFEVTIPENVSCAKCTIQVMQFMAEHSPGYFYYHCADVAIAAAAATDGGASPGVADGGVAPAADSGTSTDGPSGAGGSGGAAGAGGSGGTGGSSGAGGSGGKAGSGGVGGTGGGAAGSGGAGGDDTGGTGGTGTPPRKADSGGCAVGGGSPAGGLVLVAALALIRRRRRR